MYLQDCCLCGQWCALCPSPNLCCVYHTRCFHVACSHLDLLTWKYLDILDFSENITSSRGDVPTIKTRSREPVRFLKCDAGTRTEWLQKCLQSVLGLYSCLFCCCFSCWSLVKEKKVNKEVTKPLHQTVKNNLLTCSGWIIFNSFFFLLVGAASGPLQGLYLFLFRSAPPSLPGPPGHFLIGNMMELMHDHLPIHLTSLAQRYGSIYRLKCGNTSNHLFISYVQSYDLSLCWLKTSCFF